jgi:hypothetical protein
MVNGFSPNPTLFCLKRTDPRVPTLVAIAMNRKRKDKNTKQIDEKLMSIKRLAASERSTNLPT